MKLIKKILKIVLVLLLTITVVLAGLAIYIFNGNRALPNVDPEKVVQQETNKADIVVIGDSLAAGVYSDGTLIYDGSQDGYANQIANAYQAGDKLNSYYNFAVPGYETEDLLHDLTQNRTYNDVLENSIINEKSYINGLTKAAPSAKLLNQDKSINQALSDADIVIVTIGANDILNAVSGSGSGIDINLTSFNQYLDKITANIAEIEKHIHEQNPDADVYFYGIYFALPHKSDLLNFALQPLLNSIDNAIFKGAKLNDDAHTHTISIKEHFNSHLKTYVDNPNNIHPNEKGYHAMMMSFFNARQKDLNK